VDSAIRPSYNRPLNFCLAHPRSRRILPDSAVWFELVQPPLLKFIKTRVFEFLTKYILTISNIYVYTSKTCIMQGYKQYNKTFYHFLSILNSIFIIFRLTSNINNIRETIDFDLQSVQLCHIDYYNTSEKNVFRIVLRLVKRVYSWRGVRISRVRDE
jgi:hypothetical protein